MHDKQSGDEPFARALPLIERGAADSRNFVKKGVSWALRVVGRRSIPLNAASLELARRLAESDDAGARWVGKDALRELSGPVVRKVLAKRAGAAKDAAGSKAVGKIAVKKTANAQTK